MRGVILAGIIGVLTVPSFMVNAGVQSSRAYEAHQNQQILLAYEQTDLSSHAEIFGDYARESLAFLATPDAFFPGTSFYNAPEAPVFGPMMDCIVDSALAGGETRSCLVEPDVKPLELVASLQQ
ncbi:hypothetical protein HOC80_05525 [archaeon]|nr:hypothetical protein [archaeon]MBT4417533.1 hypothetical protein [archaeon]